MRACIHRIRAKSDTCQNNFVKVLSPSPSLPPSGAANCASSPTELRDTAYTKATQSRNLNTKVTPVHQRRSLWRERKEDTHTLEPSGEIQ